MGRREEVNTEEYLKILRENFNDSEIREMIKVLIEDLLLEKEESLKALSKPAWVLYENDNTKDRVMLNYHTMLHGAIVLYALKECLEPSGSFMVDALNECTLFKHYNIGETAIIESYARDDKEQFIRLAKANGLNTLIRALYTKGYYAGKREAEKKRGPKEGKSEGVRDAYNESC